MKKILTLTLAAVSAIGLSAQVPLGGKKISNELIGIFFEDISSAADGGLCAERLQNGAFEYSPIEKDGWGAGTAWKFARPGHSLGYMEQRQQDPVHPNNRNYMHVVAEHIGHHGSPTDLTGIGLQNTGFDGIPVKKGESFDYYGDCVTFNRQDDNLLGQSVVYDSKYKKLFVKICNAGAETDQADINLSRFKIKGNVEKTVISGNPEDENNYDAQPIVPVKETSPAKKKMKVDVQPYSITMWSFQVK